MGATGLTRYRNRRHYDVYTRDIQRYSIYPRQQPQPEAELLTPGKTFTVEIRDVDDKGYGVSVVNGVKVLVKGGATVGDKVKIRIESVRRDHAIASVIEWL